MLCWFCNCWLFAFLESDWGGYLPKDGENRAGFEDAIRCEQEVAWEGFSLDLKVEKAKIQHFGVLSEFNVYKVSPSTGAGQNAETESQRLDFVFRTHNATLRRCGNWKNFIWNLPYNIQCSVESIVLVMSHQSGHITGKPKFACDNWLKSWRDFLKTSNCHPRLIF